MSGRRDTLRSLGAVVVTVCCLSTLLLVVGFSGGPCLFPLPSPITMFKSLQKISSRYLTRNCCNSYYISSFSTLPKAGYDVQLDYEESVNHINDLHNGLKVIKFAAVRGLELNHPETGNYLTLNLLNNLHNKLHLLQGNWTANAIFMGSKSIDLFSVGIHPDDVEADGVPLYQRVQDIAELIEYYPEKNLLALYDGYITGTPFGMFLSSTVCIFNIFYHSLCS